MCMCQIMTLLKWREIRGKGVKTTFELYCICVLFACMYVCMYLYDCLCNCMSVFVEDCFNLRGIVC